MSRVNTKSKARPKLVKKRTPVPSVVEDHSIVLGGEEMALKLTRRDSSVRVRLRVVADRLVVSCPLRTPLPQVVRFLQDNEAWILRQRGVQSSRTSGLPEPFMTSTLLHQGKEWPLSWRLGDRPQLLFEGDGWVFVLPDKDRARWPGWVRSVLIQHWNATIRQALGADLTRCVQEIGKAPRQVRLRAVKSIWGSLDQKDNVTLDIALALAPAETLRYVWIYELCHLRVRNHSPQFWGWVSRFCPDWKTHRDWLNGPNGQRIKDTVARWLSVA